MTKKETNKVQTVNPLNQAVEVSTHQQQQKVAKEIITLQGITTSRVQQALKGSKTHGQYPYPARVFLKVDKQEQDIPIIFRIKCPSYDNTPCLCEWEKPQIKKGSYLEVAGHFDNPLNSNRKSFTAYSYQLLTPNLIPNQPVQIEYFSHGK